MTDSPQSQTLNIGSATLTYATYGSKKNPAILLIHGFPMNSRMWKYQTEVLQKEFFVVTYDMRGFGQSTTEHEHYTMETMVDDLIELVTHLELDRLTLVGFSMGGYVALRAALKSPALFAKLVLIDTQSTADGNEAKLKRHLGMEKLKTHGIKIFTQDFIKSALSQETISNHPQTLANLSEIAQSNPLKGLLAGLMVMLSRLDTSESLTEIKIPTLVLVGELDQITPLASAHKLRDHIPDSQLEVIAKAAHFSPYENYNEVNQHIQRFVLGS